MPDVRAVREVTVTETTPAEGCTHEKRERERIRIVEGGPKFCEFDAPPEVKKKIQSLDGRGLRVGLKKMDPTDPHYKSIRKWHTKIFWPRILREGTSFESRERMLDWAKQNKLMCISADEGSLLELLVGRITPPAPGGLSDGFERRHGGIFGYEHLSQDHKNPSMWEGADGSRVLVWQPYDIRDEVRADLERFGEEAGIAVYVDRESAWFRGPRGHQIEIWYDGTNESFAERYREWRSGVKPQIPHVTPESVEGAERVAPAGYLDRGELEREDIDIAELDHRGVSVGVVPWIPGYDDRAPDEFWPAGTSSSLDGRRRLLAWAEPRYRKYVRLTQNAPCMHWLLTGQDHGWDNCSDEDLGASFLEALIGPLSSDWMKNLTTWQEPGYEGSERYLIAQPRDISASDLQALERLGKLRGVKVSIENGGGWNDHDALVIIRGPRPADEKDLEICAHCANDTWNDGFDYGPWWIHIPTLNWYCNQCAADPEFGFGADHPDAWWEWKAGTLEELHRWVKITRSITGQKQFTWGF